MGRSPSTRHNWSFLLTVYFIWIDWKVFLDYKAMPYQLSSTAITLQTIKGKGLMIPLWSLFVVPFLFFRTLISITYVGVIHYWQNRKKRSSRRSGRSSLFTWNYLLDSKPWPIFLSCLVILQDVIFVPMCALWQKTRVRELLSGLRFAQSLLPWPI